MGHPERGQAEAVKTLVGAADPDPLRGLLVLDTSTTTTSATAYTFVVAGTAPPRLVEPYRTTAFVDHPPEIEQ